ncbi:MAG: ferrochelatase [Ectothiorhodospiraceae bacterium]|nr:ferrochelatase [Ectothiorhodospiraceae bacterium]
MPRYTARQGFRHDDTPRLGILLANLGTPEAPTAPALRRYLGEFLADPRVVELPRILWRLILHGIILRVRPARSARAYARVWTAAGSPLLTIGQAQADGIRRRLEDRLRGPAVVELGMRYGRPSIPESLNRLRDHGAERLLVLPLYPQYSGATTASTFDALAGELGRWRWIPELRFVAQYHDDPAYIACLAASIREHWETRGRGDRLLFSFHGTPLRYLLEGDPYHCQCRKTARLVAEELGLDKDNWQFTFQSRFGKAEWLQPYTDKTVEALGKAGVKSLDVICPGFSADCLETLEEIQMENADIFRQAGGGELRYIPALNDRDDHLDMLTDLILEHAGGWPETGSGPRGMRDPAGTREHALAQGARQ